MKFYTVGYGGRQPEDFLNLLKQKEIEAMVDVRLLPDRGRVRSYIKAKSPDKGIERLLREENIQYFWLVELGNIFMYRKDWREPYGRLLDRAGDLLIKRLEEISRPLCLMCAEKRVEECHRQLIADYLGRRGHQAEHIE